jgi:hypothetical protein
VEGILSLASKYDIAYLRRRALARFREFYPDDFDVWSYDKSWSDEKASSERAPDHTTLDLARQVGILCAIPAIMLRISFRGLEETLSTNLGPDDQRSMIVGMTKLQRRIRLTIYAWLYRAAPGCQSLEECSQISIRLLRFLDECSVRATFRPLEMYPGWKRRGWYDGLSMSDIHTCKACRSAAKECHTKGKRELWGELPSIFGLPSWEELLRESRLE